MEDARCCKAELFRWPFPIESGFLLEIEKKKKKKNWIVIQTSSVAINEEDIHLGIKVTTRENREISISHHRLFLFQFDFFPFLFRSFSFSQRELFEITRGDNSLFREIGRISRRKKTRVKG